MVLALLMLAITIAVLSNRGIILLDAVRDPQFLLQISVA